MENLIYISLFSNILMIGVSLITHFVTYPSFEFIPSKTFAGFHSAYSKKMLFLVGPVMLLEFLCTSILTVVSFNLESFIPFLTVVLIWLTTFFLIVPRHNKLGLTYNYKLNKKLIKYNGYRTLLWVFKFLFIASII